MTRFDAHAADPVHSTTHDVRTVVAAESAVFAIVVAIGCVAVAIAIGILALGQGLRAQVALAIGRTQASVFMAPTATRADAEALRGRIEALPKVSRAVLRTREEALAALAADGLPALANKTNPLPDVWIVTLRPGASGDPGRPLSVDVAATQASLTALPGVASVSVDDRWVSTIDRWSPRAAQLVAATNAVTLTMLAVLLAGVGFVAARAGAAHRTETAGVRAFATIGVLAGAVSVLIAAALVWGVAGWIAAAGIDLKPMVDFAGQTLVRLAAVVGVVAILAPLVGMSVGAIGR